MTQSPPRLGFLYPDHSAEDDYPRAATLLEPPARLDVVHTSIGEDAHRADALRDTGDVRRLIEGAATLKDHGVDAAMWACTSGSFVFGWEGAKAQAQAIEDFLGVPTASTSLAFAAACLHLGLTRVAIAATYPEDVADLFRQFMIDAAGVTIVSVTGEGIITGREVGTLTHDRVIALATRNDHSNAEAVLLPDTALHTIAWLDELDRTVGKPVLTANQVTIWHALRLAGHPARQDGMGRLFAA